MQLKSYATQINIIFIDEDMPELSVVSKNYKVMTNKCPGKLIKSHDLLPVSIVCCGSY